MKILIRSFFYPIRDIIWVEKRISSPKKSRRDVIWVDNSGAYNVPTGQGVGMSALFYPYFVPNGTSKHHCPYLLNDNKKNKTQIFNTPPVRVSGKRKACKHLLVYTLSGDVCECQILSCRISTPVK
jgi:hypothetical protein